MSYVATLLVFFGTLKAVNSYLHYTFDCGNQVQKRVKEEENDKGMHFELDIILHFSLI